MTRDIPWRAIGVAALALLLTTSLGVAALATSTALAQEDDDRDTNCETVVVHDAFMEDQEAIDALANGSTVRSTEANTRVTLGENNTFYQVEGQNPNAYCVHFVVKVSDEAIPPAQLPADIKSNDGEHEASWNAVHNFSSSETHTEIEFTLPAETTAKWSPQEMRIASIAWASESRDKASGLFDRLHEIAGGEDEVAQRKYDISANATGEQVTVPLENPRTGENIDKWTARYTTNDGETWHKLDTSAEDPVYYSKPDDSSIRLTFNDPDARVKFVANPTRRDEIAEEWTMWKSGIKEIGDYMPWN